jgi:hypothetical protein
MNVRLHIERLVLEGIDVPDRDALQVAVQTELARLIGERGIGDATRIGHVPRVSAPAIGTALSSDSKQSGTAIATSVYRGIGGSE